MSMFLTLLQETEPPADMTWNYIILVILIVIAAVLGYMVVKRRREREG
jgi:hypothetical protein